MTLATGKSEGTRRGGEVELLREWPVRGAGAAADRAIQSQREAQSCGMSAASGCWRRPFHRTFYVLTLLLAGFCTVSRAVEGKYSAEAMREFTSAQKEYHAQTQDQAAAWHFGRACFDLAEFATNKTERADIAQQGIAASRRAVEKDTNSAPAHYYLGLNLGQLARTRSLGALKLVSEMEREFLRARELDSHFDYAGADRTLGLLYRDAPSIGSVGNRTKAHQRLQLAVDLAPDYPENRLNLIEAFLKWGDRNSARRELKQLETDLPRLQKDFSGVRWEGAWVDWDDRLAKARGVLDLPAKVESPKHKE